MVAHRLKNEYQVDCIYESVNIAAARWVYAEDSKKLNDFRNKVHDNLALDGSEALIYLAQQK